MIRSPLLSRTLAIALAVLVVIAVVSLVFAPLWNYCQEQWFQANLLGRQLSRYQAVVANEQELSRQLADVRDQLGAENLLVEGANPAIASGNLREYVNRSVELAGAQLVSAQDIDGKPLANLAAIGLRVQVTGEIDQFVTLLNQLENSEPYIVIASLDINSTASRGVRYQQPGADSGKSLYLTLDLTGYGSGNGGDPGNEEAP